MGWQVTWCGECDPRVWRAGVPEDRKGSI